MLSCADEEGRANIMTAAWAGTICSDPVMVSVSIRPERYSHDVIERTGEFVINLTTEKLTRAADYCGVRSGRDVDKFDHLHLTKVPSQKVKAPSIGESPVCLECVVTAVEKLGTHDLFIAKVVAVSVDEQYLDERGRFALEKAGLTAYVHGEYYSLGRKLGSFGYSVRKKDAGRGKSAGKKTTGINSGGGRPGGRKPAGRKPGR
jgi:flavin reductase (DIM6/NTAB) family NADH-FMN oxidoreductase RutF